MYIVYTRVIMKIEIKPTGYGRMRFIGIDILLPCIENYRKKHFEIRLISLKLRGPNVLTWDIYNMYIFYRFLQNRRNVSSNFLSVVNIKTTI